MVLDSQFSSTSRRSYQKTKRADDEQKTRARIVDAAEDLHRTLGPAHTTMSAIAQHAGVTRATVYRHFPSEEPLFLACSSQWLSRQRLPDPTDWTAHDDALARLRMGLSDTYRYYRSGEQMLTRIHRDADAVPLPVRTNRLRTQEQWVDTLIEAFPNRRLRILRGAIGHATSFDTWRSLCIAQGLSNRAAVGLMVGMVAAVGGANPGAD